MKLYFIYLIKFICPFILFLLKYWNCIKNNYLNEIIIIYFQKTALYYAFEYKYLDIIQLLLSNKRVDINAKSILRLYLILFQKKFFYFKEILYLNAFNSVKNDIFILCYYL